MPWFSVFKLSGRSTWADASKPPSQIFETGSALAQITPPKQIGVVEQVVEVVDLHPTISARNIGQHLPITRAEGFTEATEQPGHGQINFPISPPAGGIKNAAPSIAEAGGIPTPEIAVHQSRTRLMLVQSARRGAATTD